MTDTEALLAAAIHEANSPKCEGDGPAGHACEMSALTILATPSGQALAARSLDHEYELVNDGDGVRLLIDGVVAFVGVRPAPTERERALEAALRNLISAVDVTPGTFPRMSLAAEDARAALAAQPEAKP